ncbi:hypothetical protein [Methanobrevibacter sp.]|uniref:hypothetical protein n=1 Tax=Methanobrevibacter sp. TaxID=66852 RepID=UPI0025E13EF0|nr:hypothetical protein [Methanobrevibacter sp.]MBQ2832220.1 hypothetical protein [Methanobrevibacter sp.]
MVKKFLIMFIVLLFAVQGLYAHGVDVTADMMVIANNDNGVLVKEIADANDINISVYKFTSDDEVAHQLEHMLNNSNKRILVTAYQDTAHKFLDNHSEVSDRLIIIDDVNNDTLKDGLIKISNVNVNSDGDSSFITPLISGLIIGVIIGVGIGVLIKSKK